ncbi:U3 small nucleolar RNA-associated protein 14 homolog A [Zerene cesonia]|uniref:U3 small nucleolar RNA-associated protein 14 homolog A n=1 Tax=Zerene cesonia TaxID=33412 RepID=UPI0018E59122|nr:U3 small nucleolar RNA-associated protein 14 homolog A [Zerene cesonia]
MEENDEYDVISTEHDNLISAITKLDKTQHISEPTRNEPTNQNSEFNLIKKTNKLDLSQVVNVLKDTAQHAKITKRLKNTQDKSNVLAKPLEKPEAERIKRSTGYDITKEKITKWDPVVARNRTVDFVSFPLKSAKTKREYPTKVILSNLKLKSTLEKELDEIHPPLEADEDMEEPSFPMTYEEMLEHRQQLAKLRAQQSYKAAKAKRQSKIKSKKYHRILKKERLKQQLKEFEDLQIKNPEEALKKLEELEKARALERHTLRHKNTGKWAKSKLVRAKYDKEVRQQLAEQLAVSRGLTQKTQDTASTDDEADENEIVPDLTLAQDPMNPWMMKRPDKSNVNEEFNFGYKKYLKDKMCKQKDESDSDEEENNEASDLSDLKNNILKLGNAVEELDEFTIEDEGNETVSKSKTTFLENEHKQISKNVDDREGTIKTKLKTNAKNKIGKQTKKVVSTSSWVVEEIDINNKTQTDNKDVSEVFKKLENKIAIQVDKKLQKLRQEIKKLENTPKSNNIGKMENHEDNLESLKFKKRNQKPFIDEELIETTNNHPEDTPLQNKISNKLIQSSETLIDTKADLDIDPNRFIEVKPKYLNTAVPQGENDLDELDDDEQIVPKVDIEEVFEEDDVVASFRQEKQDEINNDRPKEINLRLPGWGNWGGKGVKAPKRRKNRFISKPIPKIPRRDENKGDVIINEMQLPQLKAHKVSELPFPFTSVKDYEASIRAPIGNTFIPETAHQKLIKPSVITKAGTIIEPMDEEQLMVKRNLKFSNQNVIKLLAKK